MLSHGSCDADSSRIGRAFSARTPWPLAAVLFLLVIGCVEPIDQGHSAIGTLASDCIVPFPEGVAGLGAPISLEYPKRSLWIWPTLDLTSGETVANVVAWVDDPKEACRGGVSLERDYGGRPTSLMELDSEEQNSNLEREDQRQLALVPTGGFVDDEVGYLFYDHALLGPGVWDYELLGTGLCRIAKGESRCQRLEDEGSTILWASGERWLNHGGLVDDERAYVYGCQGVANLMTICTVNSALTSDLSRPSAYRIYNAFDGWVDDPLSASVVSETLGLLSVSPYQDGFLVTTLDLFEPKIELAYVAHPTDPIPQGRVAFPVATPRSLFPSGGREHWSLRGSSNTIHVTYFTDNSKEEGLHLASFKLLDSFDEGW